MKALAASLAAFLLASPAVAGGPLVFVDAVHGDDATGAGTLAAPYRTITKGIASLGGASGATIRVAPGVYNQALGEVFPLALSADATLQGAGAHLTAISGDGSGTLITLSRHGLVTDVTVRRGEIGIRSEATFFNDFRYLRRCVLHDNDVAVSLRDHIHTDSGFTLASCVLVGNGIAVQHQSPDNDFQSITISMYGTTVTGNVQALSFEGFGERYLGMFRTIVRGNGDDSLAAYAGGIVPGIAGCDLGDPTYVGVDGNVDVDPGLAGLGPHDVHLGATSPVRDLVAPAPPWPPVAMWVPSGEWKWEPTFDAVGDLEGDPRTVGAEIDVGADELLPPSVYELGAAKLGGSLGLGGQAEPFETLLLGAAGAVLAAPAAGWLWLAPPIAALGAVPLDADGLGTATVPVPGDPSLAGVSVYLQAVRVTAGGIDGSLPDRVTLLP